MKQKTVTIAIIALYVVISAFVFPKTTTWTAIGDSITFINEHPDETGFRVKQGYMSRVVKEISGLEYENKGYNGWTVVRIAKEIETLDLKKSDIYSVFLGTNDWWSGQNLGTINDYKNNTGTSTVYGSYRIIINKLKSLNPDALVILITPLKRLDFVYFKSMTNNAYGSYRDKNGKELADFAKAILEIGRLENYKVIDLYNSDEFNYNNIVNFKRLKDPQTGAYKNFKYPDFVNIPFDPKTDEYPYPSKAINMTYDGLHPSDKGYKVIANKIVRIIKNELK